MLLRMWLILFGLYAYSFDILERTRGVLFFILSLYFICHYFFKVRSKPDDIISIKLKRFVKDIWFSIWLYYFLQYIVNLLNLVPEIQIEIKSIILLLVFFFLFIRLVLVLIPIGFWGLLLFSLLVIVIGIFQSKWWTGITLISTLILFIYSEDLAILLCDDDTIETDNVKLSFSLKKRVLKAKLIILISNILMYFTLIYSEYLYKSKKLTGLIKYFSERSGDQGVTEFDKIMTLSVVRVFFFMILLILCFISIPIITKRNSLIKEIKEFVNDKNNLPPAK